jgi:hypothetical protein
MKEIIHVTTPVPEHSIATCKGAEVTKMMIFCMKRERRKRAPMTRVRPSLPRSVILVESPVASFVLHNQMY